MAEQAAGAVASAVITGITDRALTTVIRKLRSGARPVATDEKLQRLETLVLKLRCAVEVSEKHAIGSATLLAWRDRLREAAAEAGAVVLDFQRRAAREDGSQVASTSASAPGQQQPAGALYFTRSSLCGMAQRVRDVTRRLFSTDEDKKKLDGALEKMERFSPDITQFLLTLQLEVSPELEQRRLRLAKRSASASNPAERIQRRRVSKGEDDDDDDDDPDSAVFCLRSNRSRPRKRALASPPRCSRESSGRVTLWDSEHRSRKAVRAEIVQLTSAAETPEDLEMEARILTRKLEPTLRRMDGYIKATDDRDMEGMEWLSEWAAVLREAVERGNAVLRTLRAYSDVVIHNSGGGALGEDSDVIHKSGGGALEEEGEFYSFARTVKRLAQDEPYFAALVDLCSRKHH